MVNKIIDGISAKLNERFPGYQIYGDEDVEQDLKEPCFFIKILNPSRTPLVGPRSFSANSFDIRYFPRVPRNNAEMWTMGDRLFEEMECIILPGGDLLRGAGMYYEIIDGLLHFFVSYSLVLLKENSLDDMEDLTIETDITKG